MMDLANDRALVIKVGERYFVRYGKRGQVLTAWSLAGARLFLPCTVEFDATYTKLCQSGHHPRVVMVIEEPYVNPNPNLITESGREHLSLADRAGLLEADVLDLQRNAPKYDHQKAVADWAQYGHPVHAFNVLIGNVRQCAELARRPEVRPDTLRLISTIECLVLAWRRGGVAEHDRVHALAYPRRTK